MYFEKEDEKGRRLNVNFEFMPDIGYNYGIVIGFSMYVKKDW